MKLGDLDSSSSIAIILEFYIWLNISLLRALIALSTLQESWMRSIFLKPGPTEKVIKV